MAITCYFFLGIYFGYLCIYDNNNSHNNGCSYPINDSPNTSFYNPSIIVKFTVHLLHEMESNTINNMYKEGMSGTQVYRHIGIG